MNLSQWRFHVVATSALNNRTRSQHSITLKSLEKLCPTPFAFEELAEAVEECAGRAKT
jgi:hypothetical protein